MVNPTNPLVTDAMVEAAWQKFCEPTARSRDLVRAMLEAALPRGEEPVWIQPDHLAKARRAPFLCRVEPAQRDDFVPLYATPPLAPSVVAGEATACPKCEGLGVVDDGWLTHSAGGIEYEEPIKCVKDCPACKGRATPPAAAGAAIPDTEALMKAARDAATSLETISQLAGRQSYGNPPIPTHMTTYADVRGYAANRAKVAREAIAAAAPTAPSGD